MNIFACNHSEITTTHIKCLVEKVKTLPPKDSTTKSDESYILNQLMDIAGISFGLVAITNQILLSTYNNAVYLLSEQDILDSLLIAARDNPEELEVNSK